MSKSKKQMKKFHLEGQIQEIIIKDGYKLKYIDVETAAGNNYIVKIAKSIRRNLSSVLVPGLKVKITGEMTVIKKTGEQELKAFKIIPDFSNNSITPCKNHPVELVEVSSSPIVELKLPATERTCSKSQEKCAAKKAQILVCQKSDCQKRGANKVCKALSEALNDHGLEDQVTIKKTGCLKKCKAGPNMVIMPNKAKYSRINSAEIPQVIKKHFAMEA
ncbi:MAG: (2Fe-2S) ferredoxin domain-containing protein [Trichodesmium sp.]